MYLERKNGNNLVFIERYSTTKHLLFPDYYYLSEANRIFRALLFGGLQVWLRNTLTLSTAACVNKWVRRTCRLLPLGGSRRPPTQPPTHPATHPATRTTKSCKVHYFSSPASRCLASSARHAERNISLERALAWWTHALASLINRRPSNGYSRASVWCATEVLLASRLSGPIIQPETDTRRAVKLMRAVQNHQVWIHLGT